MRCLRHAPVTTCSETTRNGGGSSKKPWEGSVRFRGFPRIAARANVPWGDFEIGVELLKDCEKKIRDIYLLLKEHYPATHSGLLEPKRDNPVDVLVATILSSYK